MEAPGGEHEALATADTGDEDDEGGTCRRERRRGTAEVPGARLLVDHTVEGHAVRRAQDGALEGRRVEAEAGAAVRQELLGGERVHFGSGSGCAAW